MTEFDPRKTVIIADLGLHEQGGAERWTAVLAEELKCDFILSRDFTNQEYDNYIVCNHFFLSPVAMEFLKGRNFKIISHDFLFEQCRAPWRYLSNIVPDMFKVNNSFLLSAKTIITQSKLHSDIWSLNGYPNKSLGGNLWSEDDFKLMEDLGRKPKNGRAAILDSHYPTKGAAEAVRFCQEKGLDFTLLPSMNYSLLMERLSEFSRLVFLPTAIESFSRVTAEMKMMGGEVICNDLVGFAYEESFQLNGPELIKEMRGKLPELIKLIFE